MYILRYYVGKTSDSGKRAVPFYKGVGIEEWSFIKNVYYNMY